MKNSTISQSCANEINNLVQTGIDKTLWLICNYEPTKDVPIGYDGKTIQKILNMYIFAIDVGLCNKINKSVKWDKNKQKELKNLLLDIGRRRSVIGHNQSWDNGNEEDRIWYETWMKRIIGSEYPQKESEWKKVYEDLEKEERKLIIDLEALVNAIANMVTEDKETAVFEWKKTIETWYGSVAGRNAIVGQCKKLYKALNPHDKIANSSFNLNMYVKKSLYSNVDAYESILAENSLLSDANKAILISMRDKIYKRIKNDLHQRLGQKGIELDDDKLYAEWYISHVQDVIHNYCENSLPSEAVSLLPQDAIGYICYKIDNEIKKLYSDMISENKTNTVFNSSIDDVSVAEKKYVSESAHDVLSINPIIEDTNLNESTITDDSCQSGTTFL